MRSDETTNYFANKGITWQFIVEHAPWQGGMWERLICSVKRCLKKTIGQTSLTYDELHTLLVEIEGIINCRPLTYVYDDQEGVSYPLTPAHLIYGRSLATCNERTFEILSTYKTLSKRAMYHRQLLRQYTTSWKREYLLSLREVSSVRNSTEAEKKVKIAVGDVVILKEDKTPRQLWKLAKVEGLIQSNDGVVRAAKIRTLSETGRVALLRRPLQLLVPWKWSV